MWMLLIVLLNGVSGLSTVTVLQTYDSDQECQRQRSRVGFEMAAAYLHERDFVIACQVHRNHES